MDVEPTQMRTEEKRLRDIAKTHGNFAKKDMARNKKKHSTMVV
jgi:hypothetical protein